MKCPICDVPLTMTERKGVEIDYCPQCRGVWLDRGELDKIIERSVSDAPPQVAAQPERYEEKHYDDDDYKYHQKKKRKSFLDELFDF